jgi:heme exporter protein B
MSAAPEAGRPASERPERAESRATAVDGAPAARHDRQAPSLLGAALLIARKDLAIEFRTRTAFFSALVFALLAVTIFYFVWDQTAVASVDVAPGVLWVIFTFSGLLGLNRSFAVEHASRAVDALLASPVDREAIFLGKALANVAFVLGVQAVTIPAVVLFYNLPLGGAGWAVAGIAVLAAVGLVAVGTLFSAMAVNTRLAELLLPMLSLPFFIPVVMPAAQATAKLLDGRPIAEVLDWLRILGAYDIVFVAACALAFPYTLED